MASEWFECIVVGFISGVADILPVSTQAHNMLLRKFLGISRTPEIMGLLIHIGILAALYITCQAHILKIVRAKRLARIPKRKRKRPLDTRSLMDYSLLKTMLLPVILSFFLYEKAATLGSNMILVATFLFLNGLLLYIPQFLPTGNKDCRTLSRVEGLMIGAGGALHIVPGFSGIGAALSVGSVCGMDHIYCLTMVLMLNIGTNIGLVVMDIMSMMSGGASGVSFAVFILYVLAGAAAFAGAMLGIYIMRKLSENKRFSVFSYYCWGVALFTFVLNLVA